MLKRALAVLVTVAAAGRAADEAADVLTNRLAERFAEIEAQVKGVVGVYAVDLTTGRVIAYNGDTVFPQASVIKIPIMIEAFRSGRLEEKLTLEPSEAKPGGDLYWYVRRTPLTLTVRELVEHMIQSSDNTATNRLIDLLGMERINAGVLALGAKDTKLRRKMLDGAAVRRGDENVSTPADMALLAQVIWARKVKGAEEMLAIMKEVDGDFRKTVPAAIDVAAKVGEYPGTRTETAIVLLDKRPYAVSVCSTFLRPGANPIPEIAAELHAYFAKLAASNRYGNRVQ